VIPRACQSSRHHQQHHHYIHLHDHVRPHTATTPTATPTTATSVPRHRVGGAIIMAMAIVVIMTIGIITLRVFLQ
jgi:hypothetical protein